MKGTNLSFFHQAFHLNLAALLLLILLPCALGQYDKPPAPLGGHSCGRVNVCFVMGPAPLKRVSRAELAMARYVWKVAAEFASRYHRAVFMGVGFGGDPKTLPRYVPWLLARRTSSLSRFISEYRPVSRNAYGLAKYGFELCDSYLGRITQPKVIVVVHPWRLLKFDYDSLLQPYAKNYIIASISANEELALKFEPYVTKPYPETHAPSLSVQAGPTLPSHFELGVTRVIAQLCATSSGPPLNPTPTPQPGTTLVPYIPLGQPTAQTPADLRPISPRLTPSENALATAEGLSFFTLVELRKTAPFPSRVAVRANVTISNYVPLNVNTTTPDIIIPELEPVPMRLMLGEADNEEPILAIRGSSPTLTHCPAYACSVVVRVWSSSSIKEDVIDAAIDELKKRPGYNQVYINQDTKAMRKRVPNTTNKWDVTFPFEIDYEEEHAR